MSDFQDFVRDLKDYDAMPKYELQQLAIMGDKKAEKLYWERYRVTKIDTVTPEFSVEEDEE